MKKYFVSAAVLGAVLLAVSAKNNDPVLMTVNGKKVPLSEFEYLYKKNNSQQLQPQTIDEYVDMFVNYKLKVADAEAAGLDTTEAFNQELTKYCNDLARPYLRDQALADSLARASYEHNLETVTVSHIMLSAGQNADEYNKAYATLDSLRSDIIAGKTTFEDVASIYSVDRGSEVRGGFMGPVIAGRLPWAFEDMAYNTKVGEISPIVNSGFGLHIIRVEKREPAKGEVHAAHILKLTRDVPEDRIAAIEAEIDSIYEVVSAPDANFAEVAKRESQDPGSARKGGDLGWFGPGMMVQPFDSISFALANGEISKPFKTSFGYHIIKRYDHRGVAGFDEMREQINKMMERDIRGVMPEQRRLEQLAKEFKAELNPASFDAYVANNGDKKLAAYTINGKAVTVASIADKLNATGIAPTEPKALAEALSQLAQANMYEDVLKLAREQLLQTNADYRNLTNEYRDGILMFEISNRNVWDRAAKDTEGLENFFRAHRENYKFESPKYKAFIVFATCDSTMNEAKEYAESLGTPDPATFARLMTDKFGREIKVERVIAAKGENPITDFLGFGMSKPAPGNSRWNFYFPVAGKVIDAPEDAADVKGAVTNDYQSELEREWLDRIHKKYKVKVNKKVLKEVK